jgi:cell division protein FtsZ
MPSFDLDPAPAAAAMPAYDDDDTLDLGDMAEEADEDDGAPGTAGYGASAPFELSGMQAGDGYGEDYDDDVDDIVDPLAGLRGAEDAGTAAYGTPGAQPATDDADALELDDGYTSYETIEPEQDDLLASADRLAAEDRPVEARLGGGRRRPLLGGGASESGGGTAGSGAGSTLFERMANLSRSTARDTDEDDDDGDGGPALSIPRFLGRQNNQ